MSVRPLAAVMVADADPLTLTQLRRLSEWCDLVVCEATTTLVGAPREPLRQKWAELLDLDRPQLRVITSHLTGDQIQQREWTQRDSVLPLLVREDPQRPVLIADSDEFLEPEPVLRQAADSDDPVRLGLIPLFGSVDRVARSMHCCRRPGVESLRDPDQKPSTPFLLPGPALAPAGAFLERPPSRVRARTRLASGGPYGTHVTMCGSAATVARKLQDTRHHWDPRVLDELHLDLTLGAGVHPAGWWISEYREPEPWLLDLAAAADLRVSGAPLPIEHLRALRAWAQVRVNPAVPENVVRAGDRYVARRDPATRDFLSDLDRAQLTREVSHTGRLPDLRDQPDDSHAAAKTASPA